MDLLKILSLWPLAVVALLAFVFIRLGHKSKRHNKGNERAARDNWSRVDIDGGGSDGGGGD